MTCYDITLCSWNSRASLARNTGLYLSRSVSAKQSGWLQNLWTDGGTCVHCTTTCPRHQPLWPATWSSASLTHGQACHKTSSTKQWVRSVEKAVTCKHGGKMTSVWTFWYIEIGSFYSRHTTQPSIFKATNSPPRKTRLLVSIHLLIHLSTHPSHRRHCQHPLIFTLLLQAQNLPFH